MGLEFFYGYVPGTELYRFLSRGKLVEAKLFWVPHSAITLSIDNDVVKIFGSVCNLSTGSDVSIILREGSHTDSLTGKTHKHVSDEPMNSELSLLAMLENKLFCDLFTGAPTYEIERKEMLAGGNFQYALLQSRLRLEIRNSLKWQQINKEEYVAAKNCWLETISVDQVTYDLSKDSPYYKFANEQ